MTSGSPHLSRLLALDALRGAAALCVVLHHVAYREGLPHAFGEAYLAVGFFFLLSGYVVGLAYEDKLRRGMPLLAFARARFTRLYPMIVLGAVIGLLVAVARGAELNAHLAWSFIAQLLLIPTLGDNADVFLLNVVQWSLFFELFINLVHGAFYRLLSNKVLIVVVVLGAIAIVATIVRFGSASVGWGPDNFWGGFARVGFTYTAGLLLFRMRDRLGGMRLPFVLIAGALVLVLTAPSSDVRQTTIVRDALTLLVVMPLILTLAIQSQAPRWAERAARVAGDISYPLYALHYPIVLLAGDWIEASGLGIAAKALCWLGLVTACIGIAWLVAVWLDAPARAVLARIISGHRRQPA